MVIKRTGSLGPDDRFPKKFLPTDTVYGTGGSGGGVDITTLGTLGVRRDVVPESNGSGGWRWPIVGRPAYPAGLCDWRALGTGLARPLIDGSPTGGGGMTVNDRFFAG